MSTSTGERDRDAPGLFREHLKACAGIEILRATGIGDACDGEFHRDTGDFSGLGAADAGMTFQGGGQGGET